ncbi:hypothetical protein EIP91_006110 [Steccherinum ochraceum]|uniref:Uncharacterized protein n=1 Tax=Steccherinum ochraceum TaxID=92696 RepID=A0A4V2MXE0_9APHY|nr:hypothetical protein EIP91_006110 [Steccherinum ochraceum]
MLLLGRDKASASDSATDSSSPPAYRRTSIPSIAPLAIHNNLPPSASQRRAPLASLDPQAAANISADLHMSSASSQPGSSRSGDRAESSKNPDRSQDASRFTIGRPISINRGADDDPVSSLQSTRRRSLTNQPSTATTASSLSTSSTIRRPSVPGYSSQNLAVPNYPTINIGEDLYSGLSNFTFGSVQSSTSQSSDSSELISPLTRVTDSADHTPRPSISGPSGTKPPKSRSGKQKARADADMGDDEYEDEDDNERQKSRSKMRAIDDGSRRPSLPTNAYMPEATPPTSSPSPPSDPQRQMSPGSASEQEASEADAEDHGELDTDVEFDLQQHSGAEDLALPDDASQHTFGGGFDHYGFRDGNFLASDQMSLNEDDEDDDVRGASVSPVTFTQPGDDNDVGELDSRRGTLPYNMPTATASFEDATSFSREREDSMATVTVRRASRSMDDDLNLVPSTASTLGPGNQHHTAQFVIDKPQDPVDVPPEPQMENENDVYDGFNMDYIMDESARRHSISQTSFMERSSNSQLQNSHEISPFNWVPGVGGSRRPSTITVGTTAGEDIFTRHLRKNDDKYNQRRIDWSFKKESTDGRGPKNPLVPPHDPTGARKSMMPGTQEIWRQAFIGRFKVDRLIMKTEQPDKAPQQRVNVRHVVDPYSQGNKRGGPSSVIHKHSRAVAFSIFRTHSLFSSSSRRATTHMSTSTSILLATKKVQEQYTSTRTTAKLNSHGLLEDRALGDAAGTVFSPTTTAATPSVRASSRASSAHGHQDRDRSQHRTRARGPADEDTHTNASGVGSSSQTTSGWSTHSSSGVSATTSPSRSPAPPSAPSSPSTRQPPAHIPQMSVSSTSTSETATPSRRATSMDAVTPHNGSFSVSSTITETVQTGSRSELPTDEAMDLDEETLLPRTSHAEAFATVDSTWLEHARGRDQRPQHHHHHHQEDSPHSIVGAFRRKLLGQGNTKSRSNPATGPTSASLEGNYNPPWLTMAPRSKVEERERVIQNLNDSFKDVGLLPSFRGQRGHHEKSKRNKHSAATNIFAHVPIDSLYMLLPLWPGETDTPMAENKEDPSGFIIPVEDRQYLLVYYVPFDERLKKKRKRGDKKRTREEVTKTHVSTSVRLPDCGLSITGSMTEAARFLPPPSIRDQSLDDIVVGVCHTRDNGMEFLPEGLVKLGLCMPTDQPYHAPVSEDEEPEEIDVNLTPIGRAAVEMAWLGSMAVTCFGPI